MTTRLPLALLAAATLFAAPGSAQLLPGGLSGPVGGIERAATGFARPVLGEGTSAERQRAIAGGSVDRLASVVPSIADAPSSLLDLRAIRLSSLVRQNRATLDRDGAGNPVRRDR